VHARPSWFERLFPCCPSVAPTTTREVAAVCPCGCRKTWNCPVCGGLNRHVPVSQADCRPVCFSSAAVSHPAGGGSAQIRRSMVPNSRRVRWSLTCYCKALDLSRT
jgi:hypothetical protein